jgi:hypothetical protein
MFNSSNLSSRASAVTGTGEIGSVAGGSQEWHYRRGRGEGAALAQEGLQIAWHDSSAWKIPSCLFP